MPCYVICLPGLGSARPLREVGGLTISEWLGQGPWAAPICSHQAKSKGSLYSLFGRVELEGKGMDPAFDLGRQRFVDEAMARQP
jgi:hypothetical protein